MTSESARMWGAVAAAAAAMAVGLVRDEMALITLAFAALAAPSGWNAVVHAGSATVEVARG